MYNMWTVPAVAIDKYILHLDVLLRHLRIDIVLIFKKRGEEKIEETRII